MREKNVVVVKVVVRGVRNFIDRFFFKCPISMVFSAFNRQGFPNLHENKLMTRKEGKRKKGRGNRDSFPG